MMLFRGSVTAALAASLGGCVTPAALSSWTDMSEERNVAGTVHESVCHLRVFRDRLLGDSYFYSTGALYRGRYLITSAHNVASQRGTRVRTIDVSCGAAEFDEAEIDFPALARDSVWVASGYSMTRGYPEKHCTDYAIVRLPEQVRAAKPFALATFEPHRSATVTVAGYPGGYRGAPATMDNMHLFSGSAPARVERPYLINYDVRTSTGVSGAPVWELRNDVPTIVAVHVGGTSVTARGRTVTDSVRQDIDAVIDAWERGVPTAALPAASPASIGCG